jgi:hypothetical protein
LEASAHSETQSVAIGETINEALDALGTRPATMKAEAYVVYSKAIRREMKELLGGKSLLPPLSERQVGALEKWLDADAVLIAMDDWLGKVEHAVYERRFGPVSVERETLWELLEAIKSTQIVDKPAEAALKTVVENVPETAGPTDPETKTAAESQANLIRGVGRKLHQAWKFGEKIGPRTWRFVQYLAERHEQLKKKMPWLSELWDFIHDFAGKNGG